MRAFAFVSLLWALSSFASAQDVGGFYKTDPGYGGAWKRMCITSLSSSSVEVFISAGYCPSQECLNYRPANITFQGARKGHRVHYSGKDGCKFAITFGVRGARVTQSASCRNDERPYLYADGLYKFIKADLSEENCSGG